MAFGALLEEYLGCCLKVGYAFKICAVKIGEPNIYRAKLLEHIIYIFAMLGRVYEAIGIVPLRSLLDGRSYLWRRRGRFDDGVIEFILD